MHHLPRGERRGFKATAHRILFEKEEPTRKSGCEACHGPGSLHIEKADGTEIVDFRTTSPDEVAVACTACHERKDWKLTQHSRRGTSCTSCHDPHRGKKGLLKEEETPLCLSCHPSLKAQIQMPSRHPIREKKVSCSDCHNPHESLKMLQRQPSRTTPCVKCHQEKMGPFVYEHKPVLESCSACHISHGSVNQDLLALRQPALCLQCHADAFLFHKNSRTELMRCTRCHKSIHGSNRDKWFMN